MNMLERSDLMGNIYPLATDEFFQNFYEAKLTHKFIWFNIYFRGVTGTTPKITLRVRLVLPHQNHSANPDSVAAPLGLHCQYWVKPTYAV